MFLEICCQYAVEISKEEDRNKFVLITLLFHSYYSGYCSGYYPAEGEL